MQGIAKILIIAGGLLIITGLVVWLLSDKLHWFGNLPGDIKFKRDNITVYLPIVSFLLLSILLTLIINIIRRIM